MTRTPPTAATIPEISRPELIRELRHARITLVDVLSPESFSAMHIPGAINLPREALTSADGTFKSTDDLRQEFSQAGIHPEARTIAYCNGGVAATAILFALSILGNKHAANYDGSWNEWGNSEVLPVEMS